MSRSTVPGPGADPVMRAVVAAAPRVDAEFVLVRPHARTARRDLPGNVRTVGWVPLDAAMPASAAVVHHGGAGTVLAAMAVGVPQLVVRGPGDRTDNAGLVAARGVGLDVAAGEVTPAVLTRLLTDAALADAARQVRREVAAMPAPDELVPLLVALSEQDARR